MPGAGAGSGPGGRRTLAKPPGRTRVRVSALPLTMVLPMKLRMRRRAVALARGVQQLGRLLDEARGVLALREARMRDELIKEAQVGHDAADAKLPQRPVHARDGLFRGRGPGGYLHQQRVVGARDDGAGVGGAGIQAHAEAGGTAVGGDLAVVGDEVVFRILGGDAALQCVGADTDLLLGRHAAFRRTDARAGGDADLCLDQIDAGRALGHGVFHLDARIDLDEVETAAVGVLQELHRAGIAVGGGAPDPERRGAQLLALRLIEKHRRSALHHFLVAPLHGAVAFVQVHERAVLVPEDLHLDVARAAHQLLKIHLVVAEGRVRLTPRERQRARRAAPPPPPRACRARLHPSSP